MALKSGDIADTPAHADTWHEIAGLIDELAELSKSDLAPKQFHAELLRRSLQACRAIAGIVWIADDHKVCQLECQSHLGKVWQQQDVLNVEQHQNFANRACSAPIQLRIQRTPANWKTAFRIRRTTNQP